MVENTYVFPNFSAIGEFTWTYSNHTCGVIFMIRMRLGDGKISLESTIWRRHRQYAVVVVSMTAHMLA
jgi:hypothetical protein